MSASDWDARRALTVAGLIELLRQMPQDAPVVVEGCDCSAVAVGVSKDQAWELPDEEGTFPEHVTIRRYA